MSARRFPTAELYEERQRDYYGNGNRSVRSYDELDIDIQQGNPRRSAPDFLREDYGRTTAGPLVVRDRVTEEVRGPPRRREVEEDTIVIRGGRREERPPPVREIERDDITIRRGERERARPRSVDETDITIKHRDSSRPRPREVRERDDITFRHKERPRDRPREREVEREDITFTHSHRDRGPPPREIERDEISFRREDSRHGRDREIERDSVVIRNRERSLPPPRERGQLVAREREEFVVRHREPPRDEVVKDEIVIRRMEQRSPTPPPPPPPPPEPEPIIRPPIIQEVITHHRHIDHGIERARSPTPPPPPSPPQDDSLEISIRRQSRHGSRAFNEDIIYERETRERKQKEYEIERTRRRSLSAPRRRFTVQNSDLEDEAEYYARKNAERAYVGEAYNGATRDWAIVDVPPGTNNVRMQGVGGGAQEVTWQRYNGVRRSKFISGDEEISSGFGVPSKPKTKDMWTEITKDLVIKDAIESMGFDYEETDDFFYVMEYLRYEDVLQLVELSDDIRRERQTRIRQIEFEREEIRDRRPNYEDRFYEHEVSYDSRRRRY